MQALNLPDLLVMPAAGMIDGARAVDALNARNRLFRVKLAPTLIERHPHDNGRTIVKLSDQFAQLLIIAFARRCVGAGESFEVVILFMVVCDERRRDRHGAVFPAAGHHVLPYKHPQPVAVVVPAHGLAFDVLAQHVEAHVLHELDIKNHRLVRWRGIQTVRPVALIEYAVMIIRPAVKQQTRRAVFILSHPDRSHGKRGIYRIIFRAQLGIVQKRGLRRPQAQILRANIGAGLAICIRPVLGDHFAAKAHHDI